MIQISLASARVNSEMTQDDVAKRMGVSKTTIVNWEKGRVIPGIPELSMLCEIYKIPKDNIFLPIKSTKSRERIRCRDAEKPGHDWKDGKRKRRRRCEGEKIIF